MARQPRWTVYSAHREYVANCVHLDLAAAIVALEGNGATIRDGHRTILWVEGCEQQPARKSYAYVASVCAVRVERQQGRPGRKRATAYSSPTPRGRATHDPCPHV